MDKNWLEQLFINEAKPAMRRHSGGSGKEPVLGELVATENGMYDKPVIAALEITNGACLTFRESINLDYESFPAEWKTAMASGKPFEIYNDGVVSCSLNCPATGPSGIVFSDLITRQKFIYMDNSPDPTLIKPNMWLIVQDNKYIKCEPPSITVVDTGSNIQNLIVAKEFFDITMNADGWNKVTVNVARDVVDVEELPTESIDPDKIYRLTGAIAPYVNIYVNMSAFDTPMTLEDYAISSKGFPPEGKFAFHLFDSLDTFDFDTMIPFGQDGTTFHVYISKEDGTAIYTQGEGHLELMHVVFNLSPDKNRGIVSSVEEANLSGDSYCVVIAENNKTIYGIPDEANTKTVYEHNGTEWVECGSGGDSIVVDVDELPTENVDDSKIYRVTKEVEQVAEIYITSNYLDGLTSYKTFAIENLGCPPETKFVYHYLNSYDDMNPDDAIDIGTTPNSFHVYCILEDGWVGVKMNGQWSNPIHSIPEADFYTYRGVVSDISEIDINQPGYWHLISEGGLVHTYGVSKIGDRTKFYEHDGEWTEYISKEISDELEQQISDRDNQIDALDIKIGVMNFCITDEQYKKFLNVASFVRSYTDDEFKLISINDKTIDSITIPQCFYSIEPYAFDGCASLTEVILPEGVRFVDNGAFNNCTALEYIKFPSTFEQNGFYPYAYPYKNPFIGCTTLQVMDFSDVTKVIRCPRSDSIPSTCKIIVPDELYTMWIDSQYGWEDHEDNIVKASEVTEEVTEPAE